MSKPSSPFGLSLLANHFPALHGLRVLGILSVIQIHVSFELGAHRLLPIESWLYQLSQRIWFGMDMFFFLSGFLIGTILLLPDASGAGGTLKFYARRSFRIIPAYYVVLTALALLKPLDPLQRAQLWREYAYVTNYSDVGHVVMMWAWSLCVEEHFYLLVPLLVALVRRVSSHRARIGALALLWLSGFGARFLVSRYQLPSRPGDGFQLLYIPSHTRYDILLAGVLLAYLWHTERPRIEGLMARVPVRIASVALSALLFGALVVVPGEALHGAWGLLRIGTVTGLAYLNLITYLITTRGVAVKVLGHRSFLVFATLGYGVYLVHMPFVTTVGFVAYLRLAFLYRLPVPFAFALAVLAVFFVSLAFGYLLHLLVEKPALYLRDRLVPAKPPAAPAPVSA
ncbi:MAG: acyltransferase [Deltaproteobacteria bacterium]|nr:acyltransferase [Deltaproteobacteria bacterium]